SGRGRSRRGRRREVLNLFKKNLKKWKIPIISGACFALAAFLYNFGFVRSSFFWSFKNALHALSVVVFLYFIYLLVKKLKRSDLSGETKAFLLWTGVSLFYFLLSIEVIGPRTGEGMNSISVFVSTTGLVFNATMSLASYLTQGRSITRPLIKIFPEALHYYVTWGAVLYINFFFIFFPMRVYALAESMYDNHRDVVIFLQKIF
ncbi:MAG: hypothetical protein ACAH80_01475, partial [Alphaproteobacteria bacterium]